MISQQESLPLRAEQARSHRYSDSTKPKGHRLSRSQRFHAETRYSTNKKAVTRLRLKWRKRVLWPVAKLRDCRTVFTKNVFSESLSQIHARRAFPPQSPSVRPWRLQVARLRGSVWWFPVIPQVSKSHSRRCFSITVCLSSCWVDYTFLFLTPSDSKALQVQLVVILESGLGLSWQGYRGVSFWERHGPLIPVISAVPMVTGAIFPKQTTGGCLSVAAHTLGALHVCPCHRTGELVYMS